MSEKFETMDDLMFMKRAEQIERLRAGPTKQQFRRERFGREQRQE